MGKGPPFGWGLALAIFETLDSKCWILASNRWILTSQSWLLASQCSLLASTCWILAFKCSILTSTCWILAPGPPKDRNLPPTGSQPMITEENFNRRPKGRRMAEICFEKAPLLPKGFRLGLGHANKASNAGLLLAMIKCSIRAETDWTTGDNNNLPLQASFRPRKTSAHAAPVAGYERKPCLSSLQHGASTRTL